MNNFIASHFVHNEMRMKNIYSLPKRQNGRKSSVEECIFDYMASHFECQFNKNSLLQYGFLGILPAFCFSQEKCGGVCFL